MTARPSADLIDSCIQQLLRLGRHIDVENVAELLKETVPVYRRMKTNVIIRQINSVFSSQYEVFVTTTKMKAKKSMNVSLCNLYKQSDGKALHTTHSEAPTSVAQQSDNNELSNDEFSIKKRTDENKVVDYVPFKRSRYERLEHALRLTMNDSQKDNDDALNGNNRRKFLPEPELPNFTLDALGGIDKVVQTVRELVIRPLKHYEVYKYLGASPVTGVLLHGPPGSGKTKLALGTAGEAQVPFFRVSAPEIITGISGESESMLRSLFDEAKNAAPSLVFIDELDAICPKRENASREMERRIVAQLGTCIDDLAGNFVIVMAATNRAEALDPMIRRNGRFDREIAMGIPDESARAEMLRVMSQSLKLSADVDFQLIGKKTPGFVGADLDAVAKEAGLNSIRRIFGSTLFDKEDHYSEEELEGLTVQQNDFLDALGVVQPSAKREGFATAPDISWEDVGGLASQRKELEDQICNPIKDYPLYQSLGLDVPAGILLYGPPGCGKTLLAKAVASESGANFISVKGPELLNKYVGESEKAIRLVFQRARMSAPCIIFFDELDSLCCRRGSDGGNIASERVVNQLLTEMDGVQERRNVYVVAATNRPELIDPAMLRPGRLERMVFIPLPDEAKRVDILERLGRKIPLDSSIDFCELGNTTEGFSGADLSSLLRQAVMLVLEEHRLQHITSSQDTEMGIQNDDIVNTNHVREEHGHTDSIPKGVISDNDKGQTVNLKVHMHHIKKALESISPSVTQEHILHYEEVVAKLRHQVRRGG